MLTRQRGSWCAYVFRVSLLGRNSSVVAASAEHQMGSNIPEIACSPLRATLFDGRHRREVFRLDHAQRSWKQFTFPDTPASDNTNTVRLDILHAEQVFKKMLLDCLGRKDDPVNRHCQEHYVSLPNANNHQSLAAIRHFEFIR